MTAGSTDPLSTSWAELLRDKRSLAAIVRDAGRLCIQDSVDIVLDVCDELANAHANGIVHGDLGLHRVRTIWPRRPGDFVEIWALDADDTGAIDFRAAFQAPALAPEQRAGKVGDVRSDIWAVGAILHALIGGAPPQSGPSPRPVKDMLPGAPRALVSIVEQCLANDPDARPRSVDDVAGALASFASNSPERFQQLARRRIASLKAKHVPAKVNALGLLDELALKRESSGRLVAAQPVSAQSIPAAPITQPTVGELRPPTRPSYSDAQLPAPSRMPSMSGLEASHEWPQMHGAPSLSIATPHTSPPDAPTKAQPRTGTLPVMDELPPTITAASLSPLSADCTLRMANPFASAVPASIPSMPAHAPSMTPPPVEVDAPYIPPAPQAYRQRSYHPPSFGPMSIDTGAGAVDELDFPPPARVPSFSDLAEYREAKRASRRTAIMAVVAAAAVIIVGFTYGGRVIQQDRENMRAAAAQTPAQVPAPPKPAVVEAPKPAAAVEAPKPVASAKPAPSAKPSESAKPKAPVAPARRVAPAAPRKASSDIPESSEFTPDTAFKDAIGKKQDAPASSLSDALK